MSYQMISVKVKGGETFCIRLTLAEWRIPGPTEAVRAPDRCAFVDSADLDDISAQDLGLYVSVKYVSVFHGPESVLNDSWTI